MAYSDKEERARALKAVLDMIDSDEFELETRKQREEAVEYIIEKNGITCWTGTGRNRVRKLYPTYLVLAQFNQLPNYLKDGVQETVPKAEVIWRSGSSVIKPDYLKRSLLYDIDTTVVDNSEHGRPQREDTREELIVPAACPYVSNTIPTRTDS